MTIAFNQRLFLIWLDSKSARRRRLSTFSSLSFPNYIYWEENVFGIQRSLVKDFNLAKKFISFEMKSFKLFIPRWRSFQVSLGLNPQRKSQVHLSNLQYIPNCFDFRSQYGLEALVWTVQRAKD